ncbi:MAG TPA: RagB/SusD family nutrient uptake outer membrane protein [Mariniphaga sp.]|nr:RagB/SusD family nutrient uptake outer membrane protein [Mariniphaga sp.]
MKTTHKNITSDYLRRIRVFTFLMAFVLVFPSCEDVLEERPKTVAVEVFYNTAEEVETAVNAIYTPLRSNNMVEQVVILDTHTDWGYGRGSRADYNNLQGFNAANINNAGSRWNDFYLAIRNANLVIDNAPNGTSISQEDIDKYIAEARFLRAFAYFQLVRNWGSILLRTEENMLDFDLPKSPVDAVYDLIISDLTFAENNLPENQALIGKPTLYAAKTMLADVHLTLGNFSDAMDKANEVIQSGKYSLVPVQDKEDFQYNLFGPELVTSTEEIFYLKYTREAGQGSWMLWVLSHPSTGNFNFGGAYAHYSDATNPFYINWSDDDIRKSLWDRIDFGLGANTIVSSKYIDQNAVEQSRGAGNDLPIYRYAEVLLIYAEASALAANGPTPEGIEALNMVHRRAYGQDPSAPSEFDFNIADYDAQSFQDLVLQERAYEFIFEGKRWYDLKRTGKTKEVIEPAKGITIAEKAYLWPIPISELDYNASLDPATDQNPGY